MQRAAASELCHSRTEGEFRTRHHADVELRRQWPELLGALTSPLTLPSKQQWSFHRGQAGANGAGGCVIASQSRQLNFSRTVSITFHWRGITSTVSVTSSPSIESREELQHGHCAGASMTTRSRGMLSGNGLRTASGAGMSAPFASWQPQLLPRVRPPPHCPASCCRGEPPAA
jgi:hypothetical protein